jgi:hypothetical protein
MSGGQNSPGLSKLASVIKGIAKGEQDTTPVLDFGEIREDYSLLCNMYSIPIPKSDYQICRYLTYGDSETKTTSSVSVGDHGGHSHTVSIVRGKDKKVSAGDRVLVAWVGDDPVVIDVILPAEDVF